MLSTDRGLCVKIDTIQSYFLSCFLFKNLRNVLFDKIYPILPKLKQLYKSELCDILLYGINRDNILPEPRNKVITFAGHSYITKNKYIYIFLNHYN